MNKYGYLTTAQYNIGFYFSDLAIKPETIAKPMKCLAGKNFGFGVAAAYAGHHSATGIFIYNINHLTYSAYKHLAMNWKPGILLKFIFSDSITK